MDSSFRVYSGIIVSVFCFVLAFISLFRASKNRVTILFISSNLNLGLWNICEFLITLVPVEWALFTDRLSYVFGLIVVPSFFLMLISVSANDNRPIKIPKVLSFGLVFFLLIAFTPLLIKDVIVHPTFKEIPGPLYPLFVVYFLSWLYYGLIQMHRAYKASEGFKKNQLKYFLLALIVAFIAAINYFIVTFVPGFPPIFHAIEILYTVLVAYAVIRYRLMDFNLLVRMGLSYGALALVAVVIFAGVLYVIERISEGMNVTPGVASIFGIMFAVLVYETWSRKLKNYVDQFIYQSPDLKALLQEIQACITESKNIGQLSEGLAEKIKKIWKVEHVGLVVWSSEAGYFKPFPSQQFENLSVGKLQEPITNADFLIKTLESERRLFQYGVVQEDDLVMYSNRSFPGERATFQKIRRSMRWLGAAACVPIMNGDRLIGFLVLGGKNNGSSYNNEDKKILSHVGDILPTFLNSVEI